MSRPRIPAELREVVRQRARRHCEYCQTSEWLTGLECEIDHIIPWTQGGPSTDDNLCLACASCNGYKQAKTHSIDPDTEEQVALFHPRQQRWHEHFGWSEDGTHITGSTPCGRATVDALRMNHALIVAARAIWVSFGHHPPQPEDVLE